MGLERGYQFKNPSNQFNKINRLFSTHTKSEAEIMPWFITGFVDAEGCFSIKIQQNAKLKTKEHLTSTTVFNQIIEIKSGMNLNRK